MCVNQAFPFEKCDNHASSFSVSLRVILLGEKNLVELIRSFLEHRLVTIIPHLIGGDYTVQIVSVIGYLLYQILVHFNGNVFLLS